MTTVDHSRSLANQNRTLESTEPGLGNGGGRAVFKTVISPDVAFLKGVGWLGASSGDKNSLIFADTKCSLILRPNKPMIFAN